MIIAAITPHKTFWLVLRCEQSLLIMLMSTFLVVVCLRQRGHSFVL